MTWAVAVQLVQLPEGEGVLVDAAAVPDPPKMWGTAVEVAASQDCGEQHCSDFAGVDGTAKTCASSYSTRFPGTRRVDSSASLHELEPIPAEVVGRVASDGTALAKMRVLRVGTMKSKVPVQATRHESKSLPERLMVGRRSGRA